MAREIIFKVGTKEAVKNVADLESNIKILKERLKDTNQTFEENQETVRELRENQAALRQAMYDTRVSFEEVQKAAIALNSTLDENNQEVNLDAASYNELVRSMDILKQQWRATTDEATRAELGEKINAVNNRLKELDASVGNYQRNVGNYVGALSQFANSIPPIGSAATRVINPIKNATGALNAMSATPVIGTISLIASLLGKVIDALKTSEENTNKMTDAMSVFSGVGDVVTNIIQGIGSALGTVVGWVTQLLEKLSPKLKAEAEARRAITKEEIELTNMQREATLKNAEDELRIAKLKQQAADKANHTSKERIALLEEINGLELGISQRNKDIADQEYKIAEMQGARAGNSKEENDALVKAKAKQLQAEKDYFNKSKELTGQLSELRKQEAATAEAARKKIEEARRAEIEALDAIGKEIDDIIANQGEELLEQMDADNAQARDKVAQRLEIIQQGIETRQQWNEILTENEREQEEKRYQIALAGNQRIIEALQDAYTEAMQNGDLEAALDYEQQIADKKVEIEMDAARRIKEINKQMVESSKEAAQARMQTLQDAMSATSNIFGTVADLYESNTKMTKQEAERVKNLRIAAATIDMLQGVVTAISSAQELGPIAGPIMAAVNSAAVIASGMANINKIKSTMLSTSSATPAMASAPSYQPSVPQVRQVQSNSEEDRMNQMASAQRVYILSSDIQAALNSQQATVKDTTF